MSIFLAKTGWSVRAHTLADLLAIKTPDRQLVYLQKGNRVYFVKAPGNYSLHFRRISVLNDVRHLTGEIGVTLQVGAANLLQWRHFEHLVAAFRCRFSKVLAYALTFHTQCERASLCVHAQIDADQRKNGCKKFLFIQLTI